MSPTALIVTALLICQNHATHPANAANDAWQHGYEQCAQIEPEAHRFLESNAAEQKRHAAASEQKTLTEARRLLQHQQ